MAYKQKHTNSTFPFKTDEKITAEMKKPTKKQSKIVKGSFGKGHHSKSGYNLEAGFERGIKTEYGDISGTVHGRAEKNKYYKGGGITPGIKITTTLGKLKKLFNR
jgi:hypothetical protein|tara:strand:+ start:170 stop:484 length:315 start_codon:yes stop_codon:yes gene_type:complete